MGTIFATGYAQEIDTTFIMKYTKNENGEICHEEVVGYYHGEPEEELTEYYKDKGVSCSV